MLVNVKLDVIGVQEDYILMMHTSVIEFNSNGVAKTKLAI